MDIHGRCKRIGELPRSMAERAVRARTIAANNPSAVDVDDDLLPWVFDEEDGLWYSFDGNYSGKSPLQKRRDAEDRAARYQFAEDQAIQQHFDDVRWSEMRSYVLARDKNRCQICKAKKTTKLHIHHVLKRREGGLITADNLLTVCPSCHLKADRSLYDPDWIPTVRSAFRNSCSRSAADIARDYEAGVGKFAADIASDCEEAS
jgi:5-methylcytosine-specific restriction endonuclease McrA